MEDGRYGNNKKNEGAEWKRETMKEVVVKNEKREELVKWVQAM